MNNENETAFDRLEVEVYRNKIIECRLFVDNKEEEKNFLNRDTDWKLLQHFTMNPWPISTEELAIIICDQGQTIDVGDRIEQLHTAVHRLNSLFQNKKKKLLLHRGTNYVFSLPIFLVSGSKYLEIMFEGEKLIL